MHGSSSVPVEEVRRINEAGGKLDPSARGVDENEYLLAAKLGVTKINIDTDGRLVWTRVHREFFRDQPGEFDFRPPGITFMDEYAKFIAHKNKMLAARASWTTCARPSTARRRSRKDAGCGMRDAGCGMRDAGCGMRDAGWWWVASSQISVILSAASPRAQSKDLRA